MSPSSPRCKLMAGPKQAPSTKPSPRLVDNVDPAKIIWHHSLWCRPAFGALAGTALVAGVTYWPGFFAESDQRHVAQYHAASDGAHSIASETGNREDTSSRDDIPGRSDSPLTVHSGGLSLPWSIAGLLQSGDAAYLHSAIPDDIAPARVRQAISTAASTDAIPPSSFAQLLRWLESQQTIASRSLLISLAASREHQADHAIALAAATNALDRARASGEYEALLLSVLQVPRLPMELIEQFRSEAQRSTTLGASIAATISALLPNQQFESNSGGLRAESHINSYVDQGASLRNSIDIVPVQSLMAAMSRAHTGVQHSIILDVLATSPRHDAIDVFISLSDQNQLVNPSVLAAAATTYGRSQLSGDRIARLHQLECLSSLNTQQRQLLALMRRASIGAGSMQGDAVLGEHCGAAN
jgi:hypothetical protein